MSLKNAWRVLRREHELPDDNSSAAVIWNEMIVGILLDWRTTSEPRVVAGTFLTVGGDGPQLAFRRALAVGSTPVTLGLTRWCWSGNAHALEHGRLRVELDPDSYRY